jgi:hypothetical protein
MLAATTAADVELALTAADPARPARVPFVRTHLAALHTPLLVWLPLGGGVREHLAPHCQDGAPALVLHAHLRRNHASMQLQSRFRGQLQGGQDALGVLTVLPAAGVGGTPRDLWMRAHEAVEALGRGLDGGAVGWIDWRGDWDACVANGVAVVHGGRVDVDGGSDAEPPVRWPVRTVHDAHSGGPA